MCAALLRDCVFVSLYVACVLLLCFLLCCCCCSLVHCLCILCAKVACVMVFPQFVRC